MTPILLRLPVRLPRTTRVLRLRPRDRLLATAVLLLLAFSVVGYGAFASFTTTSSASGSVSTGSVTISLGATGAATNRLDVSATALAPGDSFERSFNLQNDGTLGLAALTLTTTAPTSSLLDTDATDGLHITIDRCSSAWNESGTSPAFAYTCPGTTSSVLASSPVIGSNLPLSNLSSLNAGATDHLLLTVTLPATAGNSFQNLSSTIQYAFTGSH